MEQGRRAKIALCSAGHKLCGHVIALQAGAMTGFVAAFTEGPIDFYKSQMQVQIIRSKQIQGYVRK